MKTIDATRAQRAREIYESALCQPLGHDRDMTLLAAAWATDDAEDAAEWVEIEENGCLFDGTDCGVKFSNTPHPDSVGADLPMRGITHGQHIDSGPGYTIFPAIIHKRAIALWPELRVQKRAPIESQSKPHPKSAYADLPLRGLGLAGESPVRKWTLTATEKRELAARPLHYAQVNH